MAEKLVKASWFERFSAPPDKFVILLDMDGKDPAKELRPFRDQLPSRVGPKVTAALLFAFAQWHLEVWYFAGASSMRGYLGRELGSVDTSHPDDIQNPKQHLKNLLGDRVYTSVISEEIASRLNSETIAQRSRSFRHFVDAVRNGGNPVLGAATP